MNYPILFPVKNIFTVLFLLIGITVIAQTEFKIPDRPTKIYPVNDYTGTLSKQEQQQLNDKLIAYSDSTSTEIIVCLVKTLDGDDINYVGAKWGNKWKIGQNKLNNGILLLLAVDDRRLTIQTGRGTEDAMTDVMSSIIINQYMVPYLKSNDFYGAINSGTDQIINVLQGKFKITKNKIRKLKEDNNSPWVGVFVAIFIFFFITIIGLLQKNNGRQIHYDNKRERKDDDDFFGGFGGGFFGGGGSFGGGSGGGFGGFGGGGSFGGGGASGSW